MSNNQYSQGWKDGHLGLPYNNKNTTNSKESKDYILGYQNGSDERANDQLYYCQDTE